MFGKFQILKKALKRPKTLKNLEKQQKKCFLFLFTQEEKISFIKKACFMLSFLNLRSKPSHLVAFSLSHGHLHIGQLCRHFFFCQVTRVGAVTWDPNYTQGVDFLDHDFFIILKNSHQELSNEGSNFILSSVEVDH